MTTLIAAVARNRVIGHRNTIPWYLPEDFKHFKAVTSGQVVIMGSKTWASLPKRPLPGRLNIVVSRKHADKKVCYGMENTLCADSIEEAEYLAAAWQPECEVFIIGGASIYEQAIDTATKLLISEVDDEPEGDTYFPIIGEEWVETKREPHVGFAIVEYHKGS